eukprot:TRINITY_DN67325_c10_g1_i1.p1 TRINITY_DN67325_c10_g1~~TRINITY_DN67325_c10_g1_i1.p1  ORF type:complete len:135 (+),score=7.75 TRINITY_DN67325_c10_g1_i1:1154-1558(+)
MGTNHHSNSWFSCAADQPENTWDALWWELMWLPTDMSVLQCHHDGHQPPMVVSMMKKGYSPVHAQQPHQHEYDMTPFQKAPSRVCRVFANPSQPTYLQPAWSSRHSTLKGTPQHNPSVPTCNPYWWAKLFAPTW